VKGKQSDSSVYGTWCQTGGPRAKCGPPRLFMWPPKFKF